MKSDYSLLSQLTEAVTQANAAFQRLDAEAGTLKAELAQAEAERASLAGEFAARSAALADVEARCVDACAAGRDLQGRLDAAAGLHSAMAQDLTTARAELADKVGAGVWGARVLWGSLVGAGWVLGGCNPHDQTYTHPHPPPPAPNTHLPPPATGQAGGGGRGPRLEPGCGAGGGD